MPVGSRGDDPPAAFVELWFNIPLYLCCGAGLGFSSCFRFRGGLRLCGRFGLLGGGFLGCFELCGDVGAVLDDDGGGHLADFAARSFQVMPLPVRPSKVRLWNAETSCIADLLVAHVGSAVGCFKGGLQCVDNVVLIGCELVGDFTILLGVLRYEALGLLVLRSLRRTGSEP